MKGNFQILLGDNKKTLQNLADESIDSIVTDPPYGISFLGKEWDSKKATETTSKLATLQNLPSGMKHTSLADDLEFQEWLRQLWRECYRVLKPGGYVLAFSAARTYHHTAMSLQTAGFEIRDQLMWLYSSGFPKAQDIGKMADAKIQRGNASTRAQRQTAMGEAYTEVGHYTIHTGDSESELCKNSSEEQRGCDWEPKTSEGKQWRGWKTALKPAHEPICMARKPFKGSCIDNVLTHGVGALNIDATRIPTDEPLCGSGKKNSDGTYTRHQGQEFGQGMMPPVAYDPTQGRFPSNVIGEVEGDYQKHFYCPKVSRTERHIGFESQGNNHPTVKPVDLMRYLVKLVTPPNSSVLDPFCGSGSTGMAAVELGHTFIGCEQDPDYKKIAQTRIPAWQQAQEPDNTFRDLFDWGD